MCKLKNVHNFEELGNSDLDINHIGRRGNYCEKENGCHLNNIGHIDLIFHVHVLGTYVHACAKYEVSMINPVAVHRP